MGKQACICTAGVSEEGKVTEELRVSSTCHFPQPYLAKKFSCSQADTSVYFDRHAEKSSVYLRQNR